MEVTSLSGGDWLSYTIPTKGIYQDVITFSAEENTTDADRTANVTITWGEGQTRTFKMTQKCYEPALLNEYAGSFNYEGKEYNDNLKIEVSDDFSKGVYKISGFITYNSYSYSLYADYSNGNLILNSVASNGSFGSLSLPITLKVSNDYKTISMDDQKIGYADITDYQANIKENVSGGILSKIAGIYSETWTYSNGIVGFSGTLNLELDNGTLKVVKLCGLDITGMTAEYNEGTGQLVTDGGQYDSFGPADIQPITFDVTISETSVTIVPNGNGGGLYIMNGYTTAYALEYRAIRNI